MCSASVRAPCMFRNFSSASLPASTASAIESGNRDLSLMHDVLKIFSWNCNDFSLKHLDPSGFNCF